eukprot:gnl/TRDRNA2_/TRDRNA2_181634_c0_seq1.p1 gnl/TRDRNA2_/TRDRNA2_181634_c0~~gnl/TRDRNA2_/TRDRNA2_181634_c0_seq1.p1  ORF type:complete len:227 (+),score=44.24 gnl/TRDRNA2_/TRDRNA2_181634_c0_seq1:83-763(+)
MMYSLSRVLLLVFAAQAYAKDDALPKDLEQTSLGKVGHLVAPQVPRAGMVNMLRPATGMVNMLQPPTVSMRDVTVFGRGDVKTRKGKIFRGTSGNVRPKKRVLNARKAAWRAENPDLAKAPPGPVYGDPTIGWVPVTEFQDKPFEMVDENQVDKSAEEETSGVETVEAADGDAPAPAAMLAETSSEVTSVPAALLIGFCVGSAATLVLHYFTRSVSTEAKQPLLLA